MTKVVEFWFDYGSASSHLAYWALKDIAGRTAAKIDLKPMLLGAVFQATETRSPLEVEAKGRWMILDLQNHALSIKFDAQNITIEIWKRHF